ncbi:hypothetical protein WJX72_007723 [[Myrmecia] bisecta]|uniref:Uncharacterized protein n=1 Tax=[Myrmecia] bisecta TaxID=41462 RepID=A0AAW1QFM2_9CHLO
MKTLVCAGSSRAGVICTNCGRSDAGSHARQSRTPQLQSLRLSTLARGVGKDAIDSSGWLDLAKLVTSGGGGVKTAYEDLADKLGKDVYLDVNGWHLYLRDVTATKGLKLHQVLAQQFGEQVSQDGFKQAEVEAVLKKVPVKLGGGKLSVALSDVIPSKGVQDLVRILEDYARDL